MKEKQIKNYHPLGAFLEGRRQRRENQLEKLDKGKCV